MLTIAVVLVVILIREHYGAAGVPPETDRLLAETVLGCMWVTVVLTIVSGASFFWRHRLVLWETVGR